MLREITELVPEGIADKAAKTICLAVLTVNNRFALQHRDDRPDINNPNCWGLFGGSKQEGEGPEQAIKRELKEELGLDVDQFEFLFSLLEGFNPFHRCATGLNVFEADISALWPLYTLGEGQDVKLFSQSEIWEIDRLAPLAKDILRTYFASQNNLQIAAKNEVGIE